MIPEIYPFIHVDTFLKILVPFISLPCSKSMNVCMIILTVSQIRIIIQKKNRVLGREMWVKSRYTFVLSVCSRSIKQRQNQVVRCVS